MQEQQKKRFEVKMKLNSDGSITKDIFIDDIRLDWSVDITSYSEACKMGYKKTAQEDIAKYFIKSVSEVLGRKITIEEIKTAIQTGWI